MEICQKGDQLLDEEIAKVYKGKKINKGKFLFFPSLNGCRVPSILLTWCRCGIEKVSLTRRPSPRAPTLLPILP